MWSHFYQDLGEWGREIALTEQQIVEWRSGVHNVLKVIDYTVLLIADTAPHELISSFIFQF